MPVKNFKVNLVVVKSLLRTNCKQFSNRAITEDKTCFLAQSWRDIYPITRATKVTITINRGEAFPISFIYVLTSFEHRVQDLHASQEVHGFLYLCGPETQFRQQKCYQRAGAFSLRCYHSKKQRMQ